MIFLGVKVGPVVVAFELTVIVGVAVSVGDIIAVAVAAGICDGVLSAICGVVWLVVAKTKTIPININPTTPPKTSANVVAPEDF